jgi:hypothetical protein
VARAVELTRPEHAAPVGLPPADLARLFASVVRLYGTPALRDAVAALVDDPDVQRGHDDMVKAALPVKHRARFEQLLAALSPAALELEAEAGAPGTGGTPRAIVRHVAASERSADRAALLLGGDPATIAGCATGRGAGHTHLISAIAQPGWLPLRTRLGLGLR